MIGRRWQRLNANFDTGMHDDRPRKSSNRQPIKAKHILGPLSASLPSSKLDSLLRLARPYIILGAAISRSIMPATGSNSLFPNVWSRRYKWHREMRLLI